ncbi:alpha/beta hydrolase [Rhizobium sp. CG5]|uniref:alpha/beta fold hydrolase n=1 Tax=Rhizobium sp. CG5 TaxID=2726076 RepID=UPI0020341F05|nr:alpha/beta hydrolase [Rhizobium sp. CG5]MCM2477518.1 alpha/beta hydrolase [Rhizobium sp. CG5]
MSHAEFQGAQVAYRTDGAGPALVLVHGTGGDAESNWGALVETFAKEWTVIRPDYSGSGTTADDGRELTTDYLAGQVMAATEAAGAETFHLLGFSLGAGIATRIAAEYPERVRSLILLAGFASADDPRLKLQFQLWRDLIKTDRRAMARLILLTGFSPDALASLGADGVDQAVEATLDGANWEGMGRQVELDLTIDVRQDAARITAPTLVIGCTHDHMVPPSHAKALAKAIAGSRYAELPTGHLAPMEQPDVFAALTIAFLREQKA